MVENNVPFATSLAPIASLIECAGTSLVILTTTISHFKRRRNHIQIVESVSSRRRRAKRLLLNFARQKRFSFRPAHTSAWWDSVQADLAIVLDIAAKKKRHSKMPRNHIVGSVCACPLASN